MKYYVVMAIVRPGVSIEDVQRAFRPPVQGWYRIAPNVWIVRSSGDAKLLFRQLESLIRPTGNLFISPLDISERQGWMDQKFWSWLDDRGYFGMP